MERYFEWDTHKAASNDSKHGIRFELAVQVFDDPLCLLEQDRVVNGEERWKVIGMGARQDRLLLVACTFNQDGNGNEIVRIISARKANSKRGAFMSIVRYKQGEVPSLSKEDEAKLDAVFQRPDSEIDYSDIPPLDQDFLKRAMKNPFYRPLKQPTYLRLDADIIAWLKSKGRGYQTRINAILRESMQQELEQR